MSFKRARAAIPLLLFGAALLPGCHVRVNESPAPESSMQMAGAETGCLAGSAELVKQYFDGGADAAGIDRVMTCASHSLQLFGERTRGATPGQYTFDELDRFLERYFMDGKEISKPLLEETKDLKRTLLGGSRDIITVDELGRARVLLDVMRTELLRLRPFMPLTADQMAGTSDETLSAATEAVALAGKAVGEALQQTGESYSFAHLEKLLREFGKVYAGYGPGYILDRFAFFKSVKSLLIGPSSEEISGAEWGRLTTNLARAYALRLRFVHLNQNYASWTYGRGRQAFLKLTHDIRILFEDAVAHHPGQVIAFADLDQFVDSFRDEELPVRKKTLKDFLRPAILRMTGATEGGPDGRDAKGVTQGMITRVWDTLLRWSEGQRYLEGLFTHLAGTDERYGSPSLGELKYSPEELLGVTLDQALPPPARPAGPKALAQVTELREIIRDYRPLFRGGDQEIFFTSNADRRHSFHNLSQMNWMRQAARMLLQGYSEDPTRAKAATGVNQAEFKRFTDDIRDLGIDLKLIDKRLYNMHIKRFREANLFTYDANGDQYFSRDEGTQLLAFMVSAKSLSKRVHEQIASNCHATALDPFDKALIPAPCYRDEFRAGFEEYMDHFPALAEYYRGLTVAGQLEFERLLEEAGRDHGYTNDPIESADTECFAMLLEYIEVVYTRFDRNHSGTLDLAEARTAFPVFRNAIAEASKKLGYDTDSQYEALFTYLLAHGERPHENLGGVLSLWWWRQRRPFWSFEADRMQVLKIFADLGK